MSAHTRVSAKGQVVIPKDVRDRLAWSQGSELEVVETGDGVLLRKKPEPKKLTVDEALARIRAIVHYTGPRISDEQIASAGREMAARKYERFLRDAGE